MAGTLRYFDGKKVMLYSDVTKDKWLMNLDGDSVILKTADGIDMWDVVNEAESEVLH